MSVVVCSLDPSVKGVELARIPWYQLLLLTSLYINNRRRVIFEALETSATSEQVNYRYVSCLVVGLSQSFDPAAPCRLVVPRKPRYLSQARQHIICIQCPSFYSQ